MTSRSEYRLLHRQDNADERLSAIGHAIGLVSDETLGKVEAKYAAVARELERLEHSYLAPSEELDRIISGYSKSRSLARISKLNLAILRIALYESIYDENTPMNAAISEAIKLSMTYTYQEDTSFINGVLGAFSRDRQKEEQENA